MSRRIKTLITAIFTVFALLTLTATASAGPATDVVRTKQSSLFDLLRQGKDSKIGGIFDEMLDYKALAKESLGKHWDERSEAEREQFSKLLKQLVQRAYEKNLRKTLAFEIKYLGEAPEGKQVKVKTRAEHKTDEREDPIEINFLVHETGGKWKVADIETEEVSLVRSYRSQFGKILKKKGWDELIKKMEEKVAKGEG